MKNLLFIFMILPFMAMTQWKYETVNNGFDPPYKIAYTEDNNAGYLKLENFEGKVAFYISGGNYFCDEFIFVEFVFVVNGADFKYSTMGVKSSKNFTIFFTDNLALEDYIEAFKQCSSLKIRLNDSDECGQTIFDFNMKNSSAAFQYVAN